MAKKKQEEKKKYDNFDVVVATPQCALSLVEDREEAEKFDCILIDDDRVIIRTS